MSDLARLVRRINALRIASAVLATAVAALTALVVAGPSWQGPAWSRDPGFAALDALPLPSWASLSPTDSARGSRWCVERCRVRQRQWTSTEDVAVTAAAFRAALAVEGWRREPRLACPAKGTGAVHCLRRDGWGLRLTVRPHVGDAPGVVVTAATAPATGPRHGVG